MVMCPKQEQNANSNKVQIEILIVKGRNLPRQTPQNLKLKIFLQKTNKTTTPHQKSALMFSLK